LNTEPTNGSRASLKVWERGSRGSLEGAKLGRLGYAEEGRKKAIS